MKRVTIFVLLLTFLLLTTTAYAENDAEKALNLGSKVAFSTSSSTEHKLENGLIVTFQKPLTGFKSNPSMDSDYYSAGWYMPTIDGISCTLTNTSDTTFVIKWSESKIRSKNVSGIPLLGNMKYSDAGKAAATPDTTIAPKSSVQMELYLPRTEFGDYWTIVGEPIPINSSVSFTLAIKVIDGKGTAKTFTVDTPSMSVKK